MYEVVDHLILRGEVPEGQIAWKSPSNIALIKYWGKYGKQLPRNPSLSFTLAESFTETSIAYKPKSGNDPISFSFLFDGQEHAQFADRVGGYLKGLLPIFPFLEQLHLDIRSRNSFPHSSGIASSASAFSALALCLTTLENQFFQTLSEDQEFRRKASYVARLGSGSACRSIFARAALWGSFAEVDGSSEEFSVPLENVLNEVFRTYHNAILIVERGSKSVSSSAGHKLMEDHAFAQVRYEEARKNLHQIYQSLLSGDVERVGTLLEVEAMQLHAMMMMSRPQVMLLAPNTIKILQLIKDFRKSSGHQIYFTIDAGPNVHVLYPDSSRVEVKQFIEDILAPYCQLGSWIDDRVGAGPIQIE